jgi:hypothetical protein
MTTGPYQRRAPGLKLNQGGRSGSSWPIRQEALLGDFQGRALYATPYR